MRVSRSRQRAREIQAAARNRRELIAAGLGRRDLLKLGLLGASGMLLPIRGLSSRAFADGGDPQSPPTGAFVEPLPLLAVKQSVTSLSPAPTVLPNTAAGEGRTLAHQALTQFPPVKLYEVHQRAAQVSMSPDLPLQPIWGFDGMVPGPLYVARYGEPVLVRNFNDLPLANGGFGKNEASTHLHNGHTPSESDGNPCHFYPTGKFYDQHYPNVLAGFASTHPGTGDVNEALSTLWYHDHRIDFTAQNVYKGLVGMYLLFNEFDTGDEGTGLHLPSFPEFDVPLVFTDKVFDAETGLQAFDLFDLDGILGDKFLVNGKIQPFFQVRPRRYRLRLLNSGPARFYEFFLTDPSQPNQPIPFWQISNDGNLLPRPVQVTSVRLSVAERADVIIDFSQFAGRSVYLENRLEQTDGRGPTDDILPPGQGNYVLRFDAVLPAVADNSVNPASLPQFYTLPTTPVGQARITRTFRFERKNGQWAINAKFAECGPTPRFRVRQNSSEVWVLQNNSGGWQHPIHIHFEEFQILTRNGVVPPLHERSRKDVVRLGFNEEIRIFYRFRDFLGRYPMHCHNVIHEDHAMMLVWEIDGIGDSKTQP